VVKLDQLVTLYEPVPFEHKAHAAMAEMWDGCITCHHRSPAPSSQPTTSAIAHPSQEDSAAIPACKSCHPVSEQDAAVDIHMPSLKGALHRQCLNCHREWSGANDCVICHRPLETARAAATAATAATASPSPAPLASDIVGRMHPPIPEPDVKVYVARFTPAVGRNVMFRHKEHSTAFGLKCVNCHHRDTCGSCHSPGAEPGEHVTAILEPARSWRESHGPCMSCHDENRCGHCHYGDDQAPPPPFDHARAGQPLDADHASLACSECHIGMDLPAAPACGDASCHASDPSIAYPARLPGPPPATQASPATTRASTVPATQGSVPRALIRRVRR
jgi:hypothetical protein